MSLENNKKGFTGANLRRLFLSPRVIITLAVIIGLLLFWKVAFGSTWENNPFYTTGLFSMGLKLGDCSYEGQQCKIANRFTFATSSSRITAFNDWVIQYNSPPDNMSIRYQIYPVVSGQETDPVAGDPLIQSEVFNTSALNYDEIIQIQVPVAEPGGNLIQNTDYWLIVTYWDGISYANSFNLSRTNYFNSNNYSYNSYEGWTAFGYYPERYVSFEISDLNLPTIEISFPVGSTPDFAAWWLYIYNPIYPELTMEVEYTDLETTTKGGTDTGLTYNWSEAGFTDQLLKTRSLDLGDWVAIARLKNGAENVATSTPIAFNIKSGEFYQNQWLPPIPSTGLPVSTSTEFTITCDPDSPFFERSLCKLYVALFKPEQSDLDNFIILKDVLTAKPPIGYFYVIKNAFSGIAATSTKAFQIASLGPISTYIFDPLKIGFIIIMWLGFGVWVFNRIRKLEL